MRLRKILGWAALAVTVSAASATIPRTSCGVGTVYVLNQTRTYDYTLQVFGPDRPEEARDIHWPIGPSGTAHFFLPWTQEKMMFRVAFPDGRSTEAATRNSIRVHGFKALGIPWSTATDLFFLTIQDDRLVVDTKLVMPAMDFGFALFRFTYLTLEDSVGEGAALLAFIPALPGSLVTMAIDLLLAHVIACPCKWLLLATQRPSLSGSI